MKNNQLLEIAPLYFFLITGGIWHLTGLFQTLMRWSAAPMMMVLTVFLLIKLLKINQLNRKRAWIWSALVFGGGLFFETVGVKTGQIFGIYHYGDILQPQVAGVPVAIGFAWLGIQISSLAVAQRIVPSFVAQWISAIPTALLMLLFDAFMEPAAVYLNYWKWASSHPPLQNYAAWLLIGLLFSFVGARFNLTRNRLPLFAVHAYFAQL
ncbi:MAG: carotenoid biosynthesis protein, partial [Calditrichaeota bacterium]